MSTATRQISQDEAVTTPARAAVQKESYRQMIVRAIVRDAVRLGYLGSGTGIEHEPGTNIWTIKHDEKVAAFDIVRRAECLTIEFRLSYSHVEFGMGNADLEKKVAELAVGILTQKLQSLRLKSMKSSLETMRDEFSASTKVHDSAEAAHRNPLRREPLPIMPGREPSSRAEAIGYVLTFTEERRLEVARADRYIPVYVTEALASFDPSETVRRAARMSLERRRSAAKEQQQAPVAARSHGKV